MKICQVTVDLAGYITNYRCRLADGKFYLLPRLVLWSCYLQLANTYRAHNIFQNPPACTRCKPLPSFL